MGQKIKSPNYGDFFIIFFYISESILIHIKYIAFLSLLIFEAEEKLLLLFQQTAMCCISVSQLVKKWVVEFTAKETTSSTKKM